MHVTQVFRQLRNILSGLENKNILKLDFEYSQIALTK